VVVAMIGIVLLQRSEGGGLGMGGGGGGFLTSRGTSNVLTKTTAGLAAVFFATSLVLSILAGWEREPHSIIEGGAPAAAGAPTAPLGSGSGGLLDTLRQSDRPAIPPAPSGPQVPQSQ